MTTYHIPVLLKEVVDNLNINPTGKYLDATFGGGGYSTEILKQLRGGTLFAFDKDPDSEKVAQSIHLDEPIDDTNPLTLKSEDNINQDTPTTFHFYRSDFQNIVSELEDSGQPHVSTYDGLVADLGISSHQIDSPERGFSTRYDGDLDMRMDQDNEMSARDVVNNYSEAKLANILWLYGDLENSRKIAREIVVRRQLSPIETTFQLLDILRSLAPRFRENQFFARVFQSVRIEVNDEYNALKGLLNESTTLLKPGGRLIVVAYHSLEDRLVKRFIRSGNFEDILHKDGYGNIIRPFYPLHNKAIKPTEHEIIDNQRARSARMRIGIKN